MIQFIGFERLKRAWLSTHPQSNSLTALEAFVLGAIARAFAICITFPFTRARTIIQARSKVKMEDSTPKPPSSIIPLLLDLVRREGVGSMYLGFAPELLRGVLVREVYFMTRFYSVSDCK
jgi:adenine nucleotide transporter 17